MVDPQEKEVSLVLLFLATLAFLRVVSAAFSLAAAAALLSVSVLVLLFITSVVLFALFTLFAAAPVRAGSVMIWHSYSLSFFIDICHY